MKPEHEHVIVEMVYAMQENGAEGTPEQLESDVIVALRAAAEQGYRLAKLPERKVQPTAQGWDGIAGWNRCLDAIETITLEEE